MRYHGIKKEKENRKDSLLAEIYLCVFIGKNLVFLKKSKEMLNASLSEKNTTFVFYACLLKSVQLKR